MRHHSIIWMSHLIWDFFRKITELWLWICSMQFKLLMANLQCWGDLSLQFYFTYIHIILCLQESPQPVCVRTYLINLHVRYKTDATVLQHYSLNRRLKGACLCSWSSSHWFSRKLSLLWMTFRWLWLPRSVFCDIQTFLNMLSWRNSPTLNLSPVFPSRPLLSMSQYCLSTRWLTIFQRQIFSRSEAQALHAAVRIADNLQIHTHTHALYPRFLTHWQMCIQCAHRYTHLTLRGVYVLDNTAEPTIKNNAHTSKHILTHACAAVGYLSRPQCSGHCW